MGDFLAHDGELARLIRQRDWSDTLGPIDAWPQSLKTATALLIQATTPIVMLWGEDGVMIYNDAYAGFAGGRHPQLLGSKVREGWPEVADFNDNVMRVGLAGGTLAYKDQELTLYRTGTAEQVWMNLDYSPVIDEAGRPAGVIAIVVETTGRVQSETALRESERRLRFLDELGRATAPLTSADEILAATTRMVAEHLGVTSCAYADMDSDEDGFTIRGDWAAPGSTSIVGHYSLADFGRLAVQNLGAGEPLIVNDNLAELAPEEAATFQSIGITATICMPLVKAGRLTALMAIHDKAARVWTAYDLALIREVTERSWAHVERVGAEAELRASHANLERRVEERTRRLLQAEEALRQSQKMEAVGQLTGGIAHDFNNLLAGIGGSLEMLQARLEQGRYAETARYIGAAQGATERAAALTQRLLAFSRRQTLDPKPTDVLALVRGLEELISRSIGPDVELQITAEPELPPAQIDPAQLESALLNLCINARDAMAPNGGLLRIALGAVALEDGAFVQLSVTDTGCGMTPEVQARAFDPFFTTKPLGEGTGLGLSMIYGFMRQSGGHVLVDSAVGQGTTVTLQLPRATAAVAEAPARPAASRADAIRAEGETVLVVDDEATVRMLVVETLREQGYRVLEAGDGQGGLALLQETPCVDMLVTDVGLPGGMNGRQLADLARAVQPALKVLLITGYAEQEVMRRGAADPALQVVAKPFSPGALAHRIREVLHAPV